MANFLIKNYSLLRSLYINKDNKYFIDIFNNVDINVTDSFLIGTKEELIETEFAKQIQESIRQWVLNNKSDILLFEYIQNTHNLSVNEYIALFTIFADEPDELTIETNEVHKRGRNKGKNKTEKIFIQDRWGGLSELYIFSKMFKINVSVYTLKKLCKCKKTKAWKNIPCTIRSKNALFSKLFHFFGEEKNTNLTLKFITITMSKKCRTSLSIIRLY